MIEINGSIIIFNISSSESIPLFKKLGSLCLINVIDGHIVLVNFLKALCNLSDDSLFGAIYNGTKQNL